MQLLEFTKTGIYCPPADIYIDPWKPVATALITHSHSDHARTGSGKYFAQHDSAPLLRLRLGQGINLQTFPYKEPFEIKGVKFSFHPAGHIFGSSQIRVEYQGEVWVVSGDYKLEDDGFSTPFESVPCDVFITESTFGLPVYNWKPQSEIMNEINDWWRVNRLNGITSVIFAYSLGKAQRILKNIDTSIGPVYGHGAITTVQDTLIDYGVTLPELLHVTNKTPKEDVRGSLVIAPPSASAGNWLNQFGDYSLGMASGWMMIRGMKNRSTIDRGFVLSDHADWNGLNEAVKSSGAKMVYVTHGYTRIFSQWLNEQGIRAAEVHTMFSGDNASHDLEDSLNTEPIA